MKSLIRGRCLEITAHQVTLRNGNGIQVIPHRSETASLHPGDIIEVQDGKIRVLTPNRTPHRSTQWTQRTLDPRRLKAAKTRTQVECGIREFFRKQDFIETRTPLLVPCPGMEPHIRPFEIKSPSQKQVFLPTSPEFAMKRLLAGGLEKIFQICPAFRDEPFSVTHHPEFSILEWYRAYAGYEEIMVDTEELLAFLATQIHGRPEIEFQGRTLSVAAPWPRLRVRDLFLEKVGIDLVQASTPILLAKECQRLGHSVDLSRENWDDLYFKIWLNHIEPELPSDQAVFVTRYPASQAALAVIDQDPDGTSWARRFEVYAGGLELGNAFEELTDPTEQRARFLKDMDLRAEIYGPGFPRNPLDEGFLEALAEGMPPSGGIAMGVDRMVMLLANEAEIDKTLWLDSFHPAL